VKDHLSGPNLLTSASLAAGFVALILAGQGDIGWAAGAVAVAAALDSLDGLLARRLRSSGGFGSQLDSLADVVSFGVAPALMLHLAVLQTVPVAGVAACLGFVLCGAWRLARFPLVEEPHRFIGLPIPPAGVVAAFVAAAVPSAGLALGVTVVLAVLMVGVIPFPTLLSIGRVLRRPRHRVQVEEPSPSPE
jgi:CDP-diacylglycerol--serine O-phosphatidyltransferase